MAGPDGKICGRLPQNLVDKRASASRYGVPWLTRTGPAGHHRRI